jgi:ankyrin repeat protein
LGGNDVALLLLEHGTDPGIRDNTGQTPLHSTQQLGSVKFAQWLLVLGANVNSCDNQGRTPLHVIQWINNEVALLLLEHGADPGVQDDNGQTPLHATSQSGKLAFTWWLLELGASVNSCNNQGRTPLHVIEWQSDDLALLLLECGTNPDI